MTTPSIPPPNAEGSTAEPKRKSPRPYFARLDSRIYLAAECDENGRVVYMVMYHGIHGKRYRDLNGHDLWVEALTYLGRAIRREHGLIWLELRKKSRWASFAIQARAEIKAV